MSQPAHNHPVTASPASDGVTGGVAALLQQEASVEATAGVLVPLIPGSSTPGVLLALKLTDHTRTSHRGTKHAPRGSKLPGARGSNARDEVYYRAAYVVNAARRLSASLRAGRTPRQALHAERPYFKAHEQARRGRATAAADIARWAWSYGDTLGWHASEDDRTTPECRLADQKNFSAHQRPRIGWPGQPHGATCRCVPGPAFPTRVTVDQATAHLFA